MNSHQPLHDFLTNGNTPSGEFEIDWVVNTLSKAAFGPWTINHLMRGIKGNAATQWNGRRLYGGNRGGIYLHTGVWRSWTKPQSLMPVSHGCLHTHPSGIKHIYDVMNYYKIKPNPIGSGPARGYLGIETIVDKQQLENYKQYIAAYIAQNNQVTNKEFVLTQVIPVKPDPSGPKTGALPTGAHATVDPSLWIYDGALEGKMPNNAPTDFKKTSINNIPVQTNTENGAAKVNQLNEAELDSATAPLERFQARRRSVSVDVEFDY
jgi:hypothetical protein